MCPRQYTKTTYFRPSIHGWPFGNTWSIHVDLFDYTFEELGFCGGMCWVALEKFYNAEIIDRNTAKPPQGDPLYDKIWVTQVASLSAKKIGKLLNWQSSPDEGHWNRKNSLGKRTQDAWDAIKDKIDAKKPVTITVIASSNDYNPLNLDQHHRMVAYAYDLDSPGDSAPTGADKKVTLWVYDPNYPNRDDIKMTFYLGANKSKIRLRHNEKGDKYHGFYKDDKTRNFCAACNGPKSVNIDTCTLKQYISASRVEYDFKFSWKCQFIPYFDILIDGVSWRYNDGDGLAKEQYQPEDEDIKQCPTRSGDLTIPLRIRRDIVTIEVRLLDDDRFLRSIEVDAKPEVFYRPYIRARAYGDEPCVCDNDIKDTDLYTANSADPIDENDIFRWVKHMRISNGAPTPGTRDPSPLTSVHTEIIEIKNQGNIIVPVYANFEVKNMADPVAASGKVTTTRNGTVTDDNINPLGTLAQEIFEGFTHNPTDYTNDTEIKFYYLFRDDTGKVIQRTVYFYGKSILYMLSAMEVRLFDSKLLAKYEAAARELIALGLLETEIALPSRGDPPRPDPINEAKFLKKLRGHGQLQKMIHDEFHNQCKNPATTKEILKIQSTFVQKAKPLFVTDDKKQMLTSHRVIEFQKYLDGLFMDVIIQKVISKIQGTNILDDLRT